MTAPGLPVLRVDFNVMTGRDGKDAYRTRAFAADQPAVEQGQQVLASDGEGNTCEGVALYRDELGRWIIALDMATWKGCE